jgi:DNA-binding transcriptional ArsR family regulator
MIADADIAALGAVLADEGRAAMLLALLGGDAITAGDLARIAHRSPSGASAHLRRLCDAGIVVAEDRGRNRFFRLSGPDVADALEALARVAPPRPVRSLRQCEAAHALKRARTCYDHLAGELGVALADALVERELLAVDDACFRLTPTGDAWLGALGIETAALARRRRSQARACIDWTERRPHLGGAVGAAVAETFFARGWVRRLPGGRAIAVSRAGSTWLRRELEITLAG